MQTKFINNEITYGEPFRFVRETLKKYDINLCLLFCNLF